MRAALTTPRSGDDAGLGSQVRRLVYVVVLSWNGKSDTLECLSSLRELNYPNYRVLLVDNGSTDGTVEAVRTEHPGVEALALPSNLGYTGGNNAGIREALDRGAAYVFLLNNDTWVHPGALDHLVAAAASFARPALVGASIYYYSDRTVPWFTGGSIDWRTGCTSMLVNSDVRENAGVSPREVEWVNGCAMLVPRAVFERVGLFDDRFFANYEEVDLCVRAAAAGFPGVVEPRAVVLHKVSRSFGGASSPRYTYFITRNRLLFLRKHRGPTRAHAQAARELWAWARYAQWRLRKHDTTGLRRAAAGLQAVVHAAVGRGGPPPAWLAGGHTTLVAESHRSITMVRRVVVVSSFSPQRCGIARYAAQHVAALRDSGASVITIGLPGSEADCVLELAGGMRLLRLLPLAWRSHALILHWHDQFYYRGGSLRRLPTYLALLLLFVLCRSIEIVCHEAYPPATPRSMPVWRCWALAAEKMARAFTWRRCPALVCHSEPEYQRAYAAGVQVPRERVIIRSHGSAFRRFRDVPQHRAREELGIPSAVTVFLCIGFIGAHKGFHLAVEAFRSTGLGESGFARLYVVGSLLHPEDAAASQYLGRLRDLVQATQGAHLQERFVTDEEFDTWISAASVVVLPYESAFSSSVIERAHVVGTPVVAAAVGGLSSQLTERDRSFQDVSQLGTVMRDLFEIGARAGRRDERR